MSTNSDPDKPDEDQDADATADSEDADATADSEESCATEQESTSDTPSVETDADTSDEEAASEDAQAEDASADEQATRPPTQFQAAINGGALKTALKTLSTLVDETRVHSDASGLQMRAVDPANVAMTDLTLEAAAFESYAAPAGCNRVRLSVFLDDEELVFQVPFDRIDFQRDSRHDCLQRRRRRAVAQSALGEPVVSDIVLLESGQGEVISGLLITECRGSRYNRR